MSREKARWVQHKDITCSDQNMLYWKIVEQDLQEQPCFQVSQKIQWHEECLEYFKISKYLSKKKKLFSLF